VILIHLNIADLSGSHDIVVR